MKKRNQKFAEKLGRLGTLSLLAFSFSAALKSLASDFPRSAWNDIRLLGRGDAGLATIVGGPAAFYNPAGLAWSDIYSFTLLNPTVGTNKNVIGSFQNITGIGSSSSETLSEKFAPFLGRPLDLQGGIFPHISLPHFMIGFYNIVDADIVYRDPVFPRLEVDYRNDWGIIGGAGWSYKDYFAVGASIRWINRTQIAEDIDTATLLTVTSDYLTQIERKGDAYGLNLGFQGRYPVGKASKLSLGFTIEDVGYTTFRSANRGVSLPERQPMRMNAGIAYALDLPASSASIYFDTKDLNDFEMSWSKKIYTGVEVGTKIADFRAGLYQGYWTLGASIAILPFLLVDLLAYGRELDSAAGLREDRYYVVGLRMGLDLKKSAKRKQRFTLDHL